MKHNTALEAVSKIKSGQHIFIHTAAAAPKPLVEALVQRAGELSDITIYQLHTEGPAPYTEEQYQDTFTVNALFIGANCRKAVNAGRVNFIPCFLSEVPIMFRSGIIPLDVALIQVSPPDAKGFCSLGVSVDATRSAVEKSSLVIAQVNPRMPRTHGDGFIHIGDIDEYVVMETELPEHAPAPLTEVEKKIGEHIADIIEDGATLQMGIGSIPDAVLSCLGNHKNLGIHTEMFSDGVIPLVESGVINNSQKTIHPGTLVSGFLVGSRKLYDFVDDNPMVRMLDIQYVNDTKVIRKLPKMTTINSAIEVDITGQVSADSIGTMMYSGVGGQMDFVRGSSLSQGGKPIIALPSITSRGESKIASILKPGAGVVTTRAHVHYIATEYGIVNLYGKNLKERAKLLIDIAHPSHRENLERAAHDRYHKF
ncbi:acetyl-CoA hydrolase [Owenweeksia hongkongensis DSM 17368]|uniref:Acetyl-CoA hydrolase n=1 Tax=Owenweeksia hongkongensis (strain DSM 17368 / CIP 108786 / JCM 12287 / NRRL B-23963 / UST20020801) TaxID=926562 RepID=G8R381_OWEHD|nr:acetyl-CoA hydrolase/transferase C-terminal domain-containing protein [Owenweeksia hongkongensis]AEV34106.1 acetyl-CoA hydrolase [Owenweeksia hongkongensis DSM 17368]